MTNTLHPELAHNREALWHVQHDAALSHLIRGAGLEIAGELVKGKPSVIDTVLSQALNGVKPYDLDFEALGATAEQIVRIHEHQKARSAVEEAALEARSRLNSQPDVDDSSVRGHVQQGHAGHAARTQGERRHG